MGFATNLPPATLSFLDGSFLRGELVSVQGGALVWRHANARQPIEFSTTNLNQVQLPARLSATATNATPLCRLRLAGGDELEGQLMSLDAETFELETWFAGRLRGQRAGLASLTFFGTNQGSLYEGPRAADEWKVGSTVNFIKRLDGGNIFLNGLRANVPVPAPAPAPQLRVVEPEPLRAPAALAPLPLPAAEPASSIPPPAPDERRAKPLVDRLVAQLDRQGEKPLVDAIVGWEQALLDGRRPARPGLVAPAIAPGAGAPARKSFTEAEVTKLTEAAERATTVAEFLKSDLVVTALAEKQTSRATLDRWFAEFEKPADWQADSVKVARFQAMLRAETDLLGRRLLGRAAMFVEQPAPAPAPMAVAERFVGDPLFGAGDLAQSKAAAEIMQQVVAAQKADTAADFLKSELLKAAVETGVASQRAEEEAFNRFSASEADRNEASRTVRLKSFILAETALLGSRLLRTRTPDRAERLVQSLEQSRAKLLENLGQWVQPLAADAAVNAGDLVPAPRGVTPGTGWTFRDGAFYTTGTGTLGRECHLPGTVRVEFDLAWRGQPSFRFSFFTRSAEQFDSNDGWQFYVSTSGYIYPMRRTGNGAFSVNTTRVPQFLTKNSVRLSFLLDREKETALLLADGEKVYEWKGLGRPGDGTAVLFYNYNTTSRLRLSNIGIAPWDGQFGEGTPAAANATALVQFANTDLASGEVHSIRDGKLALTTAGNRLEVPITRVSVVTLPVAAAPATTNAAGVQLSLHRNERLTLTLDKWEGNEVSAVSPVFGRLHLPPAAVRALRFNPHVSRTSGDELNWPGDALSTRP
ncbi:MAG: hypothetical protein EBS84_12230 [Proteobacteria bacterium]|nr:hypothetical protein [Verrucomicrobiota bacterium]NBU09767.1 hypothetical protein [Pseudomonadota bacterium]